VNVLSLHLVGLFDCFAGVISPYGALIWLGCFRILLGIGVGGDYPMSASVTSDRTLIRKRGTMLAYIFANQGWGSFVGSLATIIVLLCYKHVMDVEGKTSKVDGGMCRYTCSAFGPLNPLICSLEDNCWLILDSGVWDVIPASHPP
jgi:MFS family permease